MLKGTNGTVKLAALFRIIRREFESQDMRSTVCPEGTHQEDEWVYVLVFILSRTSEIRTMNGRVLQVVEMNQDNAVTSWMSQETDHISNSGKFQI